MTTMKRKTSTEWARENGFIQRQLFISPDQSYLLKIEAAKRALGSANFKYSVHRVLQEYINEKCVIIARENNLLYDPSTLKIRE